MDLFLIIVAAAAIWTVRAYFWPFAPCRRCKGRKTNRGSTPRRFGNCGRCGGSGMRQVLGSRQVHQAVQSLVIYRRKSKEK